MTKPTILILTLLCMQFCLLAEIREVVILQTTDVHGARNFARVITALQGEKSQTGSDNVLLIDCGDLTSGSMETSIDHGQGMIDAVNVAGYDVFVPGNHDFDFGIESLCDNLRCVKPKILCSNLRLKDQTVPVCDWAMFRKNGVKIAVIGFTIPHLDMWIPPELTSGTSFSLFQPTMERVIAEVRRARPDVIILACHTGNISAGRLTGQKGVVFLKTELRTFPEISLVLGGHTHQDIAGDIPLRNTLYVQAPHNGRGYARVTLQYDTEKQRVKNIHSKLVFVHDDTPETEISQRWTDNITRVEQAKMSAVATIPFPLTPLKSVRKKCILAELFAESMADAAHTPCGFSSTYTSATLFPGTVTEKQVFELIPYENYICVLSLSPSEVRKILEEQLSIKQKNAILVPYGIQYQLSKDGKSIVGNLKKYPSGTDWIDENDRMDFAFSSYVVCSGGGRHPSLKQLTTSQQANYRVTRLSLRNAFLNLLKKRFPPK